MNFSMESALLGDDVSWASELSLDELAMVGGGYSLSGCQAAVGQVIGDLALGKPFKAAKDALNSTECDGHVPGSGPSAATVTAFGQHGTLGCNGQDSCGMSSGGGGSSGGSSGY